MKIDGMPILHSALTAVISQDKPSTLPKATKISETGILEDNETESETEGEVITIYISPSESNDASSGELEESMQSISSSETEVADIPEPFVQSPRKHIFNKRYVGDCSDVFSGNLRTRWNSARAKVDLQKKKIKALQQRNRRLRNRIVRMKSTLKHLQSGNNPR